MWQVFFRENWSVLPLWENYNRYGLFILSIDTLLSVRNSYGIFGLSVASFSALSPIRREKSSRLAGPKSARSPICVSPPHQI